MESAPWMRLAYQYQDDPAKGGERKIVVRLPEFLNRGTSTLEIARKTRAKAEEIDKVLKELAQYDLVKVQSSGVDVPFGESLYSLTAEGVQFFKMMGVGGPQRSA